MQARLQYCKRNEKGVIQKHDVLNETSFLEHILCRNDWEILSFDTVMRLNQFTILREYPSRGCMQVMEFFDAVCTSHKILENM